MLQAKTNKVNAIKVTVKRFFIRKIKLSYSDNAQYNNKIDLME